MAINHTKKLSTQLCSQTQQVGEAQPKAADCFDNYLSALYEYVY